MITFVLSVIALILGYLLYSGYIERIAGIDSKRVTPAYKLTDDLDYVPMTWWRVFLIQFLNIAGLGPIFGAVAGAMWGPVAFLWIEAGCKFAEAFVRQISSNNSLKK